MLLADLAFHRPNDVSQERHYLGEASAKRRAGSAFRQTLARLLQIQIGVILSRRRQQ
jgi:hypothetical protein